MCIMPSLHNDQSSDEGQMTIDKAAVHRALVERMEAELAALTSSQMEAQSGAFHSDNKAESSKDTRSTEASYLARGLAERVVAAQDALTRTRVMARRDFDDQTPIGLSALVHLEDDASRVRLCFLAPVGGGVKLQVDDHTIAILTPGSPLGEELLGKEEGDEVEFQTPQGIRTWSIEAVW